MTLTRDRIEEMRAEMQGVGDHCAWAFHVADLRGLLALAERALEPQGQALPDSVIIDALFEAQAMHKQFEVAAIQRDGEWHPRAWLRDFAHAVNRAYASQLALPAGPVPEDIRNAALEEAAQVCDARRTTAWAPGVAEAIRALKSQTVQCPHDDRPACAACMGIGACHANGELLEPSPAVAQPGAVTDYGTKEPAVAQPVLSDEDAELLRQAKELHDAFTEAVVPREGTLLERMQYLGRYVVALKDAEAKAAVAQPVADEREAFEQWAKLDEMNIGRRVEWFPAIEFAWNAWKARAALCQPAEASEPVALKTHGAWDGLEALDSLPDGTELHAKPVQGSSTLRGSKFGWPCQPAEEGGKS